MQQLVPVPRRHLPLRNRVGALEETLVKIMHVKCITVTVHDDALKVRLLLQHIVDGNTLKTVARGSEQLRRSMRYVAN